VQVTVLADNDGPYAREFRLPEQDKMDELGLAAAVATGPMFLKNKSFAEVAKGLGKISPSAGMAFASRNLQPSASRLERIGLSLPGRTTYRVQRRRYWVDHVVLEAQHAFTTAFTDPPARAIAEEIDRSLPCFCVFTIPADRHDQVAWEGISAAVRQWLRQTHSNVTPLFTAGNGVPDPRYNGGGEAADWPADCRL
jgi:hypothetical protein